MKVPSKVSTAFHVIADLQSDASPNRITDPKSAWARKRAVEHMTSKQLKTFAKHANEIVEFFGEQYFKTQK